MLRYLSAVAVVAFGVSVAGCAQPTSPSAAASTAAGSTSQTAARGGRAGSIGAVYVRSQGLYYDTFVAQDPLPMEGRFQLIADGETEYGPGDPGYLGGRWWEDLNHNGRQDPDDHFFLCPLLGPGRTTK